MEHVPAVRLETFLDVFGERDVGVAVDSDFVVVVDGDEVAELQVPSEGARLGSDTFLETTITQEHVGLVVDEVKAVLVVDGAHVCLADGKTDSVGNTLAERTGGDFDAVSDADFGVAGGDGVDLPKAFQVIHRDLVAGEVEHDVLERTSVAVGEDEAVTVDPLGVGRAEAEELGPQNVGDGSHAHGCTGVTRVGLGDHIGGEGTNGAGISVDCEGPTW